MTLPKPHVVIAGAGPAGMILAHQLVSNGVPVRVLERHGRVPRAEVLGGV